MTIIDRPYNWADLRAEINSPNHAKASAWSADLGSHLESWITILLDAFPKDSQDRKTMMWVLSCILRGKDSDAGQIGTLKLQLQRNGIEPWEYIPFGTRVRNQVGNELDTDTED